MAYLPTFFYRKRGPPRTIWHSWAGLPLRKVPTPPSELLELSVFRSV